MRVPSVEIARRYPGLPQMRLWVQASKQQVKLYRADLDILFGEGRVDYLTALHRRTITLPEVRALLKKYPAPKLPKLEERKPLKAALDAWLDGFAPYTEPGKGLENYKACRGAVNRLLALAPADAGLGDLPVLLRQRRTHYAKLGQARAYNLLRTALQAFLRDTVGKRSDLYLDVVDVPRMVYRPKREGNPQTVPELLELANELGPVLGEMALSMAFALLGPNEYWGAWERAGAFGWHIHGTKRGARDRRVPHVIDLVRPAVSPHAFRRAFAKAARRLEKDLVPYDLRRSGAMLLSNCVHLGLDPERLSAYLGHRATIDGLYSRPRADRFLEGDSAIIRQFVTGQIAGHSGVSVPKLLPPGALAAVCEVTDEQAAIRDDARTQREEAPNGQDTESDDSPCWTHVTGNLRGRGVVFE